MAWSLAELHILHVLLNFNSIFSVKAALTVYSSVTKFQQNSCL